MVSITESAAGASAAEDDGSGASFVFSPLAGLPASLTDGEAQEKLTQWNIKPYMNFVSFRFDKPFDPQQSDAFLNDFFNSPVVQAASLVSYGPESWGGLGSVSTGGVKYAKLPTTVLRLDFFDRLKDEGIVRDTSIQKCFDVQVGDILVSDRLRKLLLDESSEEWEVFSAAERKELIFHVLQRLAVGGGMNQWDETIEPYFKLTKQVYKDLVTVNKGTSGQLQVSSHTYAVDSVSGSSASLFPRPSPHNFCYVIVDPIARHAKIWYAAWFPMM